MKTPQRDWAIEKVIRLLPNFPAKKTLIAIAKFADPHGKNAFPAIDTIAMRSVQSRATVKRHIKELERLGFLTVKRQEKYSSSTNHFTIHVEEETGFVANPVGVHLEPLWGVHHEPLSTLSLNNQLTTPNFGVQPLILKTKNSKKAEKQRREALQLEKENSRKPELSPEVEHLIQSVVQKLGESVESDERERVRQAYVRRAYEEAER